MGDDEDLTSTIEEQLAEDSSEDSGDDSGDDPETQPLSEQELQAENAATSLDQPSGDIG